MQVQVLLPALEKRCIVIFYMAVQRFFLALDSRLILTESSEEENINATENFNEKNNRDDIERSLRII